jgi:Pyruvate/2-oxoacid:ferredoxin oxidoreductase gamma subunit
VEAQRYVGHEMSKLFAVANLRDRAAEAAARPAPLPPPSDDEIFRILGLSGDQPSLETRNPEQELDLHIKVAGFGGQGVLMLGEILAEAGLEAGYEVSWLPSYSPEMRSGTSNCQVRIGNRPIDSPLVNHPNILLALKEPSLCKFLPAVEEGGIVLYDGAELPAACGRNDVRLIALPFTKIADALGGSKAANMVMLGALLEATSILDATRVEAALSHLVTNPRLFELDLAALARGREEFRRSGTNAGAGGA